MIYESNAVYYSKFVTSEIVLSYVEVCNDDSSLLRFIKPVFFYTDSAGVLKEKLEKFGSLEDMNKSKIEYLVLPWLPVTKTDQVDVYIQASHVLYSVKINENAAAGTIKYMDYLYKKDFVDNVKEYQKEHIQSKITTIGGPNLLHTEGVDGNDAADEVAAWLEKFKTKKE